MTNSHWQVLVLWMPSLAGTITAIFMVTGFSHDLSTDDLRRLAGLCASLLIAGLASTGVVAFLGNLTNSDRKNTPLDDSADERRRLLSEKIKDRRIRLAAAGVLVSLVFTCAAIITGALANPSGIANFVCIGGFTAAVLQIFAGPLSVIVARAGGEPFLLDEIELPGGSSGS